MSVQIRLAERRDAAGIRAIYNHYVTESTALFDMVPRTLDEQVQWIDEHSGAHPAVVAVVRGEDDADHVVGFGSLSPFRPRPGLLHDRRELGVPARRVPGSRHRADGPRGPAPSRRSSHGFHSVIARIAGEQRASIALHAACGFEIVGTEREVGRKFGRWLDVVEMQRLL